MRFLLTLTLLSVIGVASAASIQDELVVLQDELYETIQSTHPDSVEKFSKLSAAIAMREEFIKQSGRNYIIVNKKTYMLRVVIAGKQVMEDKAIIGTAKQPTPLVNAAVTAIVTNPGWTVSENTALIRIAPRFAKDPNYAISMGYEIYSGWGNGARRINPKHVDWQAFIDKGSIPYKIYQKPSRFNSLGKIKFIVPGTDGIFIHGSPYKSLFDQEKRDFSAGCVRIQKTTELASLLLNIAEKAIQKQVDGGNTKTYKLSRPFKFFVVDWPVTVNSTTEKVAFLQ